MKLGFGWVGDFWFLFYVFSVGVFFVVGFDLSCGWAFCGCLGFWECVWGL